MDSIERIVNDHHNERKNTARIRRIKKHLDRVISSAVIAVAFLICALIGWVHPGLAIPVMVVALMFGCYHLGRCVRFGMRGTR